MPAWLLPTHLLQSHNENSWWFWWQCSHLILGMLTNRPNSAKVLQRSSEVKIVASCKIATSWKEWSPDEAKVLPTNYLHRQIPVIQTISPALPNCLPLCFPNIIKSLWGLQHDNATPFNHYCPKWMKVNNDWAQCKWKWKYTRKYSIGPHNSACKVTLVD